MPKVEAPKEPEWARGYPVKVLKEYAQVFKDCHGPHVYGAFGLVKETTIAEALSAGAFALVPGKSGPSVAAIQHTLSGASAQHDFTGRSVRFLAGDVYVRAFAARSATAGRTFLQKLLPCDRRRWVEIFMEDEVAYEAVRAAHFSHAFTKVMAGSEIKGLFCSDETMVPPNLPAPEYATLKVCTPNFVGSVQRDAVVAELANAGWCQHYSSYNKRQSWTAFSLRGYVPNDPGFIIKPAEMSANWKKEHASLLSARCEDTAIRRLFPRTNELLSRIPAQFERVRFMKLAPNEGELARHADITDRAAGTGDGRIVRLHIPLVTNRDVIFSAWTAFGEKISKHFPERSICYLDTRKPHTVVNGGKTERIHLVVDAVSSASLRRWLAL